MKPTIALLFSTLAVALAAPPKAELAQVRKVYLLSMTSGMDQYLANRLTGLGVFQVVTDPKKADAIFTDHLDEAFESRQAEWFPEPIAPVSEETASPAPSQPALETATRPVTAAPKPAPAAASPQTVASAAPDEPRVTAGGLKGDTTVPRLSFRRAKGTVFLVDPRSRQVLWSIYARPKNTSAVELDRTAGHIAARIRQDLKGR